MQPVLATAIIARLGEDVDSISTPEKADHLARTANSAFVALSADERTQVLGFGTASLVIANILFETAMNDTPSVFDDHDVHRVSALLAQAFIAGRELKAHHLEEANLIGRLLLDTAETIGRSAFANTLPGIGGAARQN